MSIDMNSAHDHRSVRDGQGAPVTCLACGCRLEHDFATESWFHFGRHGGRDARGDRVECVDLPHDVWGRPALAA